MRTPVLQHTPHQAAAASRRALSTGQLCPSDFRHSHITPRCSQTNFKSLESLHIYQFSWELIKEFRRATLGKLLLLSLISLFLDSFNHPHLALLPLNFQRLSTYQKNYPLHQTPSARRKRTCKQPLCFLHPGAARTTLQLAPLPAAGLCRASPFTAGAAQRKRLSCSGRY